MKLLKQQFLLLIALMLVYSGALFAQDTIKVAPGFNTIRDAIKNNPGKTLLLERGGVYVYDEQLKIEVATTIIGETEPLDKPPAQILLFTNPGDASIQHDFFTTADFTIRNVATNGWVSGADHYYGFLVYMDKPGITLTIDHCLLVNRRAVYQNGGHNNVTINITNNILWANYNPPHRGNGYFGYWAGDSLEYNFTNNTLIGTGRALEYLGAGPHSRQTYDHNTIIEMCGELFWMGGSNPDWIVKNNIFYNAYTHGEPGVPADSLEGVIPFKILGVDGDTLIDGSDSERDIQVLNNLRYTDDRNLAHLKALGAYHEPFLSDTVLAMFKKYGWKLKDNMFTEVDENWNRTSGVDPQFAQADSLAKVSEIQYAWDLADQDSTLRPAFIAKYGSYPAKWPGWLPINPATGKKYELWEIVYPIPFDFKPTNPAVQTAATDGYPLGDLNWYGPQVVADWEAGRPYNPSGVERNGAEIPNQFSLSQNYPNPFNPTTTIEYSIPNSGEVQITVFDVLGREVVTLVNQEQAAGNYSVEFNASNLTSGIYFYKMKAGGFVSTQKMILMK